jgi:hypothetical protein
MSCSCHSSLITTVFGNRTAPPNPTVPAAYKFPTVPTDPVDPASVPAAHLVPEVSTGRR